MMSMLLECHYDVLVPGRTHSLPTAKILNKIKQSMFMDSSKN